MEEEYLLQAWKEAEKGKTPFGAVIVKEGKVLASVCNTVSQSKDPTAHAEVNAIRKACEVIDSTQLQSAVLYTTCEPCPMCMSAIIYAGIGEVVYGASIPTISKYLPQISLRASEVLNHSDQKTLIKAIGKEDQYEKLLEQYS